jgi:hypothetical protein
MLVTPRFFAIVNFYGGAAKLLIFSEHVFTELWLRPPEER